MGVEKVPLWFPDDAPSWFRLWLQAFVRDVLSKMDPRNAIGVGVDISGSSDQPATISTGDDVSQLFDADYAVAEADDLLPNARVIAPESGVTTVTDEGPGGNLQIGVAAHGIGPDKLFQAPPASVLANPTSSPGDFQTLAAATDGDVLQRSGGALVWAPPVDTSDLVLQLALSDLTTALTTGTSNAYVRAPRAFTITAVRASLLTVSSSGTVTVDINVNGSTILSTKLTIDASEKTSVTAATPAVVSSASVSDDDEITFDIDAAGTGAKGLIVTVIGS